MGVLGCGARPFEVNDHRFLAGWQATGGRWIGGNVEEWDIKVNNE